MKTATQLLRNSFSFFCLRCFHLAGLIETISRHDKAGSKQGWFFYSSSPLLIPLSSNWPCSKEASTRKSQCVCGGGLCVYSSGNMCVPQEMATLLFWDRTCDWPGAGQSVEADWPDIPKVCLSLPLHHESTILITKHGILYMDWGDWTQVLMPAQ